MLNPSTHIDGGEHVKGVSIACDGEVRAGVNEMASCDVPLNHDVFIIGEVSPVSKLIGIPLLVLRLRPAPEYTEVKDCFGFKLKFSESYFPNKTAGTVMMCCGLKEADDPLNDTPLFDSPTRWSANVGSVIVVREDRKLLDSHHVQALLSFAHTALSNEHHSLGCRYSPAVHFNHFQCFDFPLSDTEILEKLTPGEFKDFYMLQGE